MPSFNWILLSPSPTVNLVERAKSSLSASLKSSDDDSCDHNSSAECEKPVSTDSLAIGLGVGIPAAVTLIVLGFFLLRNYRKDKKESLEHDPDFDENGEATALPDFPQMEQNPFSQGTHHSMAGLPKPMVNRSNASISVHSSNFKDDPYLDNFVLPYHNQTGSKVSLDEYARNLGTNPGFSTNQRGSAYANPGLNIRTRNSSISNLAGFPQPSTQVSPQKSGLKKAYTGTETTSPTKSFKTAPDGEKYTNLPNDSVVSHSNDYYYSNTDTLNETSASDDSKHPDVGEKYSVNYENESSGEIPLNKPISQKTVDNLNDSTFFDSSHDEFTAAHEDITAEEFAADSDDDETSKSVPVPDVDLGVVSPFADKFTVNQKLGKSREVSPESEFKSNPHGHVDIDTIDEGDGFDFSNNTTSDLEATNDTTPVSRISKENGNNTLALPETTQPRSKSPRISAFNLLKNDSDDEESAAFEDTVEGVPLSAEQDEELKRMKSVYKVYFDPDSSVKYQSKEGVDTSLEDQYRFQHDPDQPLPNHNMDHLRINKDLKTDTSYDKRLTTTSSIYAENNFMTSEDQQYYDQQPPHQQYYQPHPHQQQQQQGSYFPPQQQHQIYHNYNQQPQQPPPVALPPLQTLPSASDIRKSTLQTYTNFHPRSKNQVTSPTGGKQPFVPIENDGVWTSPITSPGTASQPAFNQPPPGAGYVAPLNNSGASPVIPSATQLARSSVVMLNPVTEITKHRKFKPAGSLNMGAPSPTMMQSNGSLPSPNSYSQPHFNSESNHDNDLIPGNRNDVRRMMNTNF